MKNVMIRAWEIAKEGAAKFGGKVREYFSESLKQAWSEFKTRPVSNSMFNHNNIEYKFPFPIGEELPALEGSEKQIKWAVQLRNEFNITFVNFVNALLDKRLKESEVLKIINLARFLIENRTSASFWIENRENINGNKLQMLQSVYTEFKAVI
ncbi:hypothetical protein R6U77_00595 [Lysinibacillus louembei]|uniref:Uncharacterized protein n=1 Tax=Lysinibacillus louembei TaxID=1470088 RepID=A0ABZ0RZ52_9BACI|nr:hypothetical protein [Lysinibacillus louembei]WPK12218.1 hypothetical protein R6U77_00595 [Lysinibacillus louembei]